MVRRIFKGYLQLRSLAKVVAMLAKNRIRTRRGKVFSVPAVRVILGNPIYVGWVSYSGRTFRGQHETLVDQADFDKVTKMLVANRKGKN